ncbi:hypothetical protein [Loktanella sp. R86503]|uniref:hypothetical protein n=1 Tax=Loktanella sp. R86503 TaxID=3093847 RepID=UPI0036DE1B27
MLSRALFSLPFLSLAACGSSSTDAITTAAGFAAVNAQGVITGSATADDASGGALSVGDIGQTKSGYAYLVESEGNTISARSALINPAGITTRPTTGTARFTADFQLSEVRDTNSSTTVTEAEGSLPINIALGTGRVTGSGDGLQVSGQMNATGPAFTGTTTWRGVTGDLQGRADNTRIIGAFNGANDTAAYAGGFIGSAR